MTSPEPVDLMTESLYLLTTFTQFPHPPQSLPLENHIAPSLSHDHLVYYFYCFRATPAAYGSSQAKCQIGATAASLHHSHSSSGSKLCLWPTTTTHSNARSLTHWVRSGIEPASSWIPVRFLTCWATTGTPTFLIEWIQYSSCSALPYK